MDCTIRPSAPADAPGIRELLTHAGLAPNLEPQALDWKYWLTRADWSAPRSFVAARGAQILAHAAAVPGRMASDSGPLRVLHLIDWAASPQSTGLGSSLMKHIGGTVDVLLAVGGSEQTLRILPHLGFKPCGTAEGYARVIHPLRRPGASGSAWKVPARLARRIVWRAASPLSVPASWRVRRLTSDDPSHLAGSLPRSGQGLTVMERSSGLLRHALKCPIVPMELYSMEGESGLAGYFLLAFAPGQARLADCWISTGDPAAWQALLQHAASCAGRHRDVAELVAWSSDPVMARALTDGGFHRRNRQPILLRPSTPDARIVGPLRVQMLDTDAAYLHSPLDAPWT